MYKCKYCGREFEKSASVAAHTARCKNNPKREENIKKTNAYLDKANKQRLKNLAEDPARQKKEYTFICKKCGKEYTLLLNEIEYNKGQYRKYCSRSCANSKLNDRGEGLTKGLKLFKKCCICGEYVEVSPTCPDNRVKCEKCKRNQYAISSNESFYTCKVCKKHYKYIFGTNTRHFCCRDCQTEYNKDITKYLPKETLQKFSEVGRRTAASLENIKRSKNEIYFCKLCKNYFNNVEHNVPLFNGWDADVIIHDIKFAILWNGKWHYEELNFKGKKQTLKKIQNRDSIKLNEIKNYGYNSYIIKDLGNYNKEFVEQEFDKFIKFLQDNTYI